MEGRSPVNRWSDAAVSGTALVFRRSPPIFGRRAAQGIDGAYGIGQAGGKGAAESRIPSSCAVDPDRRHASVRACPTGSAAEPVERLRLQSGYSRGGAQDATRAEGCDPAASTARWQRYSRADCRNRPVGAGDYHIAHPDAAPSSHCLPETLFVRVEPREGTADPLLTQLFSARTACEPLVRKGVRHAPQQRATRPPPPALVVHARRHVGSGSRRRSIIGHADHRRRMIISSAGRDHANRVRRQS